MLLKVLLSSTMLICLLLFSILEWNFATAGVGHTRVRQETGPISCQNFKGSPTTCLPLNDCIWLQNAINALTDFNTTIEEFSQLTLCNSTEEKILTVCCPQESSIDLKTSIHTLSRKHTSENKIKKILLEKTKPAPTIMECGKSNFVGWKIINGQLSKRGNWPWMAALRYKLDNKSTTFGCGGVLISDQWVITAAHCIQNGLYQVRLGDLNLESDEDDANPIDYDISEQIKHPLYSSQPTIINDIGLIRLKNSVQFTNDIHPVCMLNSSIHEDDKFYLHYKPFVTGYGYVSELSVGNKKSEGLQVTQIHVTSISSCSAKYKNEKLVHINESVICAGNTVGNRGDACRGDSGGPLMIHLKDKRYYLAGIVSVGALCGPKHSFPGVYTKVIKYKEWISQHTGIIFPS